MYSHTSSSRPTKRPNEDSSVERTRKIPRVKIEDDSLCSENRYKFRILLPNGTTLELKLSDSRSQMPIEQFVRTVKKEYFTAVKEGICAEPKRRINWDYKDLHFTDAQGSKIMLELNFKDFMSLEQWHFLKLHDGSAEPEAYDDMWDLTPDTDLLKELPDDYTFETALADLIDNSLQAVWTNRPGERRLISVELHENRISIFDTGPGMDGRDGNIAKWGKMGASLHRSSRPKAVGGRPPYLMPFFGMFGYGGPVATMHLGRCALVSSKTRSSNIVYTLHLEKDALMNSSHPEKRWMTKGGVRDPSNVEKVKSPHGSFTRVAISGLKMRSLNIKVLQCRLKDIYFPYIQCDDMSGKTSMPIEFQVNGINLAEIEGGEVATTNLHSCNGPEFILQLHMILNPDNSSTADQRKNAVLEANARLKCVYFPVIEGEENINRIINKLGKDGLGTNESYEGFSRVSIRRLGRLLPDARWAWLPFMEPKQRKGETAEILKRCCFRVKCFVDTDSGFSPTPSKTDLAHHHPYTSALKNFGNMALENKKDVQIEIYRDGKKLNLSQLEKQYHDWIFEMHDRYDEEIDTGLDECTLVIPSKDKKLGRFSDVVRAHKEIKRKGTLWKAGQKIKILKGACSGCHKNNVFATLEHILLGGLQGDACGEARLICRPLGVPEVRGCHVSTDNIDIRDSISVPISVIDSGKCIAVDDIEWKNRLEMHDKKLPSSIDILSHIYCQQLGIEGGLLNGEVKAGDVPPENIVAVIRSKAFNFSSNSKELDQKFIVRDNLEMSLAVKLKTGGKNIEKDDHIYSARTKSSSCKGFHGLYIFPLREKIPKFKKAGCYTFLFSLNEIGLHFEQVVQVKASVGRCSWRLLRDKNERHRVRIGSAFPHLSVACYDQYGNNVPFENISGLKISLISNDHVLGQVSGTKLHFINDNLTMTIEDILVMSSKLDKIRPNYEATLNIRTSDGTFSLDCPCQVMPGSPVKITAHPQVLKKKLVPGQVLDKLALEVFDYFGNHVKEDELICLQVDGFLFLEGTTVVHKRGTDYMLKVDVDGYVDLSNILKVSKGYGKDVIISVVSGKEIIFKLEFQTEMRELRTATKVFKQCEPASQLQNIVFEITDSEGVVDETINDDEKQGQMHNLKIMSDSFDIDDSVRYSFRHGRCTIRTIPLPQREGIFSFKAVHSRYPELNMDLEVHVDKVCREDHDDAWILDSAQATLGNLWIPSQPPSRFPVVDDECTTPRSSNRNVSPLDNSPFRGTPKQHTRDVSGSQNSGDWTGYSRGSLTPQSSKRKSVPFDYSPFLDTPKQGHKISRDISGSQDLGDWTGCSRSSLKDLRDDLANYGLVVVSRQRSIEILELQRTRIQQNISDLQASIAGDCIPGAFLKEFIRKQIEDRSESAASVICRSLEELPFEERPSDVLGIVALLGSVQSIELSRMLANYLGEEQMLAIVCNNLVAAETLQSSTLNEFASKFGLSVSGGYHALCLEDVRPTITESRCDTIGPLPLRMPTLPDGSKPRGFMGYAVNMITIEASHVHWKTKSGHGLRETLFYRLFGELQVYEDRDCMKMAGPCIRDGAISLDGGIMRGNGLVSLGHWEPNVYFPVPQSARCFNILNQIESRKVELLDLTCQLEKENQLLQMDLGKLQMSRQRYNGFRKGTL